jgi:hypothetical protein
MCLGLPEKEVVVEEAESNGCGECVRGCLGFFASMREMKDPDTSANPIAATVEVVVDVVTLAAERTLQQFMYHDMRRAVQTAERNMQTLHRRTEAVMAASAAGKQKGGMWEMVKAMSRIGRGENIRDMEELMMELDEQVWSVLKETVVKYELVMRSHEEHYANRTDGIVEVKVVEEVVEEIRIFMEGGEGEEVVRSWEEWEQEYRNWKKKLNRLSRVLKMTMDNDNRGKCLFWMCRSCGVTGG